MPDPPKGSKLLNVTELPPEYTAGQCYDVFAKFGALRKYISSIKLILSPPSGHIFSCIQTAKGTCQVIFYSSADAETAQTEMNFSNLGTYQIIVRFPSKYDQKDSFKAGRGVSTAAASRPARRTVSEKVSSNGSLRQQSSTMHRSASGPIRITDPIRLIVQNVPLALKAPDLFSHFESYGNLQTAALAYDQSSGSRKPLGLAVLVYTTPEEASRALQALNGQFLQPLEGQTADMYRALQPLYIRLWEPRGDIEKATAFEEPVKAGTNLQANAKPFVTGTPSTSVDTPDRREVSFSSSSSTVVSPSGSRIVDSSNGTIDLTPDLKKHRRLLATALEDLPLSLRNEIGGYLKRPDVVADVLVRQLQDEGERKRCIFDEAFLMTKLREALPLLEKEGDTSKGDSSPTRLYERGKLLQVRHDQGQYGTSRLTFPGRIPALFTYGDHCTCSRGSSSSHHFSLRKRISNAPSLSLSLSLTYYAHRYFSSYSRNVNGHLIAIQRSRHHCSRSISRSTHCPLETSQHQRGSLVCQNLSRRSFPTKHRNSETESSETEIRRKDFQIA